MGKYKLSKQSYDAMKGLDPLLQLVIKVAIETTPIDYAVVEGIRSDARQQFLYASGRTRKGEIITYKNGITNKSKHQVGANEYGKAVDIYPYVKDEIVFDDEKLSKELGKHIKAVAKGLNINIEWGGDWKQFTDLPHFQINR